MGEKVDVQTDVHEGTFDGRGGIRLSYHCHEPLNAKATIVLVHGLGEHSGRYAALIEYFVQRSYAVGLYDQRGHGRSEGKRGHADHFDQLIQDLLAFIQLIKTRYPKRRLFLCGHSLGGLVAPAYAIQYPSELNGMILSSAALKLRVVPPRVKRFMGNTLSRFAPSLTIANGVNPLFLSHDPQVVQHYCHDPLVHNRVSLRLVAEILRMMQQVFQQAAQLACPCLILQAGDDRIIDPNGSQEFFAHLRCQDKTLKVYEGFYHELFHEPHREQVFVDIARWLHSHL